jgi:hypothetical protein
MNDDARMELEAYLDGQLSGERLGAFERRLRTDAQLAAQVDLQRRIDGSLTRCFVAPPPAEHALQAAAPSNGRVVEVLEAKAANQPVSAPRRVLRWPLALAASIALLVGVPYLVIEWRQMLGIGQPAVQYADTRAMALDLAYNQQVNDKKFKPDWVCKTDDEFAGYFADRLGQPLKMKPLVGNVADWGVSFTGGITPRSMGVLARIDGQPVVVFVDRLDADKGEKFSTPCHLHMFRREVGELVLYEITPFDQAKLLELFYVPGNN